MPEALSAYLDFLRFLAACVVVISHLNYPAFGGHWMPGDWVAYGPDAVIVFFVLSGYVIAYVADRKERTVGAYLVSRLSRIWSVAIPALALAAIADNIGWRISPIPYNAFPSFSWHEWPMALLANATFVNELWFAAIYPLSDGPFWSLGFEFWYYLIFAAVFYFTGRRRILLTALAAAIAGPKILLLLPIWWAGVELYRIPRLRSPAAGWFAFALPLPLYVAARMADLPEHILWHTDALGIHYARFDSAEMFIWYYVVGALVVLHFLGAKTVMAGQLTGIMQRLANDSGGRLHPIDLPLPFSAFSLGCRGIGPSSIRSGPEPVNRRLRDCGNHTARLVFRAAPLYITTLAPHVDNNGANTLTLRPMHAQSMTSVWQYAGFPLG